uniref:C-type lectin domain-containing protein n=1 Tax=Cyprinus carpio TaxID=7962 RepID=A0A8C1MG44_CYPCA
MTRLLRFLYLLITSGSVCSWTLGNGLINGVASSDTGQQVNHQHLVTVLACQEPTLADGLNTAVINRVLLSAMEVSMYNAVLPEYQFMNQSMTWLDAQSYCRARFTDLATVTTMNDVNRLVNTVTPGRSGSVWIGLHAVGVKRWVWSMGDISISQENMWHPGEPNGDGECVRSFNGSWYDESCSTLSSVLRMTLNLCFSR